MRGKKLTKTLLPLEIVDEVSDLMEGFKSVTSFMLCVLCYEKAPVIKSP